LLSILTQIFLALNNLYFFEPTQLTFDYQRQHLCLLYSLLKHEDTRKLSLNSIFFDKVKLPLFIDIKPPDTNVLKQIIPDGYSLKKSNFVRNKQSEFLNVHLFPCRVISNVILVIYQLIENLKMI